MLGAVLLFIVLQFAAALLAASVKPKLNVQAAAMALLPRFHAIDLQTMHTLRKIVKLFEKERIDSSAFHGVDGYGYGDLGREKYDNILAQLLGAEAALARLQFFSGTHAISTALFACLRPGDEFVSVSGKPYDTLEEVIGLRPNSQTGTTVCSLKDWNIVYHELPLLQHDGQKTVAMFDIESILLFIEQHPAIKLVHIQRSCGYQWRPSLLVAEIGRLCSVVRESFPSRKLTIFCDNCYGELVEAQEPCSVGADLVAGSLIKNLGGTLAPSGGYVAGKAELVAACATQLSAPGVEGGATFNQYRKLFQGLFMAPSVVGESLKGAEMLAYAMGELGFECNPRAGSPRTDIIQAVRLRDRAKLIAFCETVQRNSPVGAHIRPIPGQTAGYGDEVIFADGTFIDGSTLELSADGPLREPFVAFSQGCTHWTHWAIVLEELLQRKEFTQ
jgi:cystathionine beta-lyase family protein involved in aluminum resistance